MLLMTTNLKRKDGAIEWIEVPSHESTIIVFVFISICICIYVCICICLFLYLICISICICIVFVLKRKDGAVEWIEVPSHESTIIFSSTASCGRRYVANLITSKIIISPQAMFCVHCVFHIAVCCCSFSSLFDIVLSEGEGVARSGGKEELGEQQKRAECKKATHGQ